MNNELVTKLLQYLENVESFTKTQFPDFADQFIKYEIWECKWLFSVSLIGLIFFFMLCILTWLKGMITRFSDEMRAIFALLGLVFFIFAVFTVVQYTNLKELEIAPKVYLVKQAKNLLIKGN